MPNSTNTTNGTWTAPSGLNSLTIEVWGAGGGGGGSNNNSTAGGAGGAGGGAYATITVTGLVAGNTYPLVIGAGGTGGTGNANGTVGGTTTFNNNSGGNTATIVGANGGGFGIHGANTGNKAGIGGAANVSAGITSYKGGNGANNGGTHLGGGAGAGAGNANAGTDSTGQTGATGVNGGGTGGNGGARNQNGNNYQTNYGAGGGGAGRSNTTPNNNRVGGLGGAGVILLAWTIDISSNNHSAYTYGGAASYPVSDNQSAYIQGSTIATPTNKSAYLLGGIVVTPANKAAYLTGSTSDISNINAYLGGSITVIDNQSVYTEGFTSGGPVSDSKIAFLIGLDNGLVPNGDITISGIWKNEVEGITNLYQSIDEYPTAIDSDYIWNTIPTSGNYYECSLSNPLTTPGTGDIVVFWRGRDKSGLGTQSLVQLRQGDNTVIASQNITLTNIARTYYFQLTAGERANITDWTDLRIRIMSITP